MPTEFEPPATESVGPASAPSSEPGPSAPPWKRILWKWIWVLPLAAAAIELVSFQVVQDRVVEESDWRAAAERVDADFQQGDLVISAPDWTDPMLRLVLGHHLDLSDAGRSDLAPYDRLWVLSIRGHNAREAPESEPDFDESVGPVRIRRWDLGPSPVIYDFVDHIDEASVTLTQAGTPVPCPYRRTRAEARGLNNGPAWPAQRHQCDARPWLWTGATVNLDLDLQTRHCIWQHPAGLEPVTATFHDVPLGERMIFYAGIYYNHEHPGDKGDVVLRVRVDGDTVGRLVHADGDSWKRIEVEPRSREEAAASPGATGTVSIEVTAQDPHLRTLCWAGTVRSGERNEERLGAGAERR